MNDKFYVSLEAEELLIEKGYPIGKAELIYNERRDVIGCYPADRPTKAEAIDWLESNGIVVEIWRPNFSTGWACSVEKNRILEYDSWMKDDILFPTRLEAEEAAIIKALELL
jgi:hypothetical protein